MPSASAEINLEAIRGNLRAIRRKTGSGVRMMAVVKANAYGHGAVNVARAALDGGADTFGVAHVEEAVDLRQAGITSPILALGISSHKETEEILAHDLAATVCDMEFARALSASAAKRGKNARVHVKIDTGMGRIGVRLNDAASFVEQISSLPGICVEGIFTHFPSADEEDRGFTCRQIEDFRSLLARLEERGLRPPLAHAANSGAVLDYPDSYLDMVRAGLIMYGCYPSDCASRSIAIAPALTFKTHVVFVKEIDKDDSVSYGRTFKAARKTRVATIPVGYADGFSRRLSNRGQVLLRGRRVPVIGRVCMDQTMLDVSEVPEARVGDEVILYGSQGNETVSVEDIARMIGTAPHDVLCAIGQRVTRIYHGE
ncbi:MAG: alanine racemase [Armatimonadota bacterium]|nr:alanine racemase [Armatimonadota bacterium]